MNVPNVYINYHMFKRIFSIFSMRMRIYHLVGGGGSDTKKPLVDEPISGENHENVEQHGFM